MGSFPVPMSRHSFIPFLSLSSSLLFCPKPDTIAHHAFLPLMALTNLKMLDDSEVLSMEYQNIRKNAPDQIVGSVACLCAGEL
jgi:hypothetical protein